MANKKSIYLQIIAYIMLAIIFIFILGIEQNCSRIQTTPNIGYSGSDTLDIGILYNPGSLYRYGDSISGINTEIVNSFSIDNNKRVKIWPLTSTIEGLDLLQKGALDILASLPLDNNIKSRFRVSESVYLDRLVLIQSVDSLSNDKFINSSLDLDGKRIHVAEGSSAIIRLKNLANEIGGKIEIVEEPDLSDELLTLRLANGSIEYAVVNEHIAKNISKIYPNFNYDNSLSFTQFQVWLFNPKDSLICDEFNLWLQKFVPSENYRRIINKYSE